MDEYIFVLCIFLMSTGVHSLQCYSCNNCTKVESSHLVTCGESPSTSSTTTSSTTTSPSTTTSTTTNPTNTTTTTTTSNPTNTTATVNTTQPSLQFDVLEGKERFIENTWEDPTPAFDSNCFCENGFCECVRNMERAEVRANETFVCVTDTINLNDLDIIRRDCAVSKNTTKLTCLGAGFFENCKVCDTDGCNVAISIKFSASLVIFALILTIAQ